MTAPAARSATRDPEEVANAVTHGVGAVASVAAAAVLIVWASLHGDAWQIVGVSVFASTLIALYTASTLYHAARHPVWKARLKLFDHAAIYLLIAGTYTPFMIDELRGGWGWSLLGVIWGLAVVGVALKLVFIGRFKLVSTLVYVGMGWLILVAAVPVARALEPATIAWLVTGGLAYTAGTFFYMSRRVPYAHAVWHGFVLAGSVCHGVAVSTLLQ
ncbi:MAG: PAQR family membrane homeostasis protein TrhA [Gemmatimonadota bacterium]